jgi:hypothetical protein
MMDEKHKTFNYNDLVKTINRDFSCYQEKDVDKEIQEMAAAARRAAKIDRFLSGYCPM